MGKRKSQLRFEVSEKQYSLLIDASGKILETEMEIKMEELPANAKAFISKNYAGQKIKETAKISKKPQKLPTAKAL